MSTTVQADARKQGVVLNKPASVKKGRSVKWKLAYRAALIPAIILVLWQTLSTYGVISQQLFSSPLLILKQYISLIADGELGRHLRISVVRASLGFMIGWGS